MKVALDIEADGLDPTRVWCIVTCDLETDEVKTYYENVSRVEGNSHEERDFDKFKLDASAYTLVTGHNLIGYDLPVLRKLHGFELPASCQVVDTLILSHLLKYEMEGGHSLEAWGVRLSFLKLDHNDFSSFSDKMLEYCINDTKLSAKLYHYLKGRLSSSFDKAIEVEHAVQEILQRDVKEGGFPYDKAKADYLRSRVEERVRKLDEAILASFPPRPVPNGTYVPKLTRHGTISRTNLRWYQGTDYSVFTPGCECVRISWELFNPGSVKQVVQRLTDNGWWEPTERTDGYTEAQRTRNREKVAKLDKYGWKLNETNLATLTDTAPEGARYLVERLALNSRLTMLDMWERSYNPTTKAIHGTINGIGTWTHRCSHNNPNLANIATAKTIKYKDPSLAKIIIGMGACTRSLFHSGGWYQVGCDADGIQLRLFAHYANDQALIKANVNGNKDLGTDIHSLNQRALGHVCRTRDDAKTWIYAYLLGAGKGKLGRILKCSQREADKALSRLLATYESIAELRRGRIPRDAARGYFEGLDGRLVCCDSEHLMLSGYLQNGEALVMKHAMVKWRKELKNDIRLLTFVHDEWQTMVCGDRAAAEYVGKAQADSIRWAGEQLGVRCPLKGNFVVGKNWYDTH